MRFTSRDFTDETIELDGNQFPGCTFTGCQMRFRGDAPVVLDGCAFYGCSWELDGPAATTIAFLSALYAMGGRTRELVEATFENIRRGGPAEPSRASRNR